MIHLAFGLLHLFLRSGSLLGLGLGPLLAGTSVPGVSTGLTESPVGVLGGLVITDGALLELVSVLDGESLGSALDVLALLGSGNLLSGSVTLLGLAVAAGEENEALLELLKTLDVGLQGLLGDVLAAGVDRDTNGGR